MGNPPPCCLRPLLVRSRGKGRRETVPGFEVLKNPGFVLFLPFGPLLIVRVRSSSSPYIATCGMQHYSNIVRRIASWSVRHFPGHFPLTAKNKRVDHRRMYGERGSWGFFLLPQSLPLFWHDRLPLSCVFLGRRGPKYGKSSFDPGHVIPSYIHQNVQ